MLQRAIRRTITNSMSTSTMSRPQLLVRAPTTSHCIPEEPVPSSPKSIVPSLSYSSASSLDEPEEPIARPRRASTILISQNASDVQRIMGESGTRLIDRCCGGGCCMAVTNTDRLNFERVPLPDNDAFRAMGLKIDLIPTSLSQIPALPPPTIRLLPIKNAAPIPSPTDSSMAMGEQEAKDDSIDFTPRTLESREIDTSVHPPNFVQPHPPYNVYSAKLFSARSLTKPGAEKRTYHFDLDVTDYPEELGVDFKVGGAIGIMAPNEKETVEELMDLLCIPRHLRDRPVLLKTAGGFWPTVWDGEKARELITTRRDLLTWCTDIQSYAPTKNLTRLLAEYASDPNEKRVLEFLCSAEGQNVFCDFRTGPHITMNQLLHAFPSTHPPLELLFAQLKQLMPRFYSLSSDPHQNCVPRDGCSRLIEIAVTVHETDDWRGGLRTGVGSGFFERQAMKFIEAEARGEKLELRIPMFKGLMANPLASEYVSDGPMLLIGAGVGVAPFRGFVQRRLKKANCANKVWVLQGIRDSLLDELYTGEWGVHESEVKKVVQSRKHSGKGQYVQDEVLAQADLVWFIINSVDGRVFVCGSTKGMGEGVEKALVDVSMAKGNLGREEAQKFWNIKKEAGQYVAETW
ncbi:hypothetical protein BJ875DRAFT_472308 [Amylocarpus encephaloides]|uniref:FAD-binding FR-type domain-containing protein n=1 Tax=Amylocarpus encephaloides TaxID=45428 RepID=A0A9P8C1K7_9HELO|nr:hypothetical protein BJ875DRAFT_472308 [Amylocarpus encephaloides]